METHYIMDYDDLRFHLNHKIEIVDLWDWETNKETGLQIICNTCKNCGEPILEIDNPE